MCFLPYIKKKWPYLPDKSAEAGRAEFHGSFYPEEAQENISNSFQYSQVAELLHVFREDLF